MKKTKETLNPKIRQMIESDIIDIEKTINNPKDSYELFLKIKTKYQSIDKTFFDNIVSYARVGDLRDCDFTSELKQMNEKLKVYLTLDMIPIKYEENVASGINVNIGKINNKGIIGNNATQSTNKSVDINTTIATEKKESWISKLFRKRS